MDIQNEKEGMNMEPVISKSRQLYIERINVVQDYIENHLDEEINIQKLSEIASFSEYHFQRIFKQFTSESLYSFIKRLRLEKAIFLLRSNPKLTIQDIALSVGFSNQASFAKALKEKYQVNASQIRKMDDFQINLMISRNRTNGKVLANNSYYNKPVDLTIQIIEPIKVLYTRYTGAYKGNSDLFSTLFTKLYLFAEKHKLVNQETKWFVAYHDYSDLTEEEKLRLSVCMSINNDVAYQGEFGCMELAGGRYAVGSFLLGEDEYQGAWNYMICEWLPDSGYFLDDRLCFEYYPPQEQEDEHARRVVEIFVPITPL
ncbi:AraC family transcriptional regulator [Defluviitalea raffinosedens]|uniref:AraC family transcriptional regulator n=1 Tax=Defluviitalea raffinosedens TaxID=1450156 RepID=UPI001956DDAF|nr:GyrI-like domain-containing protein [Defluviitalea raffinosedens]MBM7687134.1 AraC family transcriptional regulator [Defluviitalea raffinosedens]